MVRSKLILLFLLLSVAASAQVNRYIVFFKDKTGTSFDVSRPLEFLSQRSIDRRQKQGVVIGTDDLPVNSSYVAQVKNAGAQPFFKSRWMNAVLVETTPTVIDQVKLLSFVKSVELVAPNKKLSSGRVRKIRGTKSGQAAATNTQLQMIGIDKMHEAGIHGEGISIAVFDGGFLGVNTAAPFQPVFTEGRLRDTFDFVARSGNVYAYDDHGTEVLSVIAGFSQDVFIGGAYKAVFHLYVTEDVASEYRVEEYNWLFAAERADSIGVDVINSSLGYNIFDDAAMNYTKQQLNGTTAVISLAAKKAIDKGIVVVCSAGNEGNNTWQTITPPADVNGILATGSVTSTGVKSSFSSVGPTSDNRIKPDVVAMGSSTYTITPTGTLTTTSGTSLASPLITSLAAGVWQTFPSLTASEVVVAIRESATKALSPDNLLGYGIPNYTRVKNIVGAPQQEDAIAIHPNPVSGNSVSVSLKNPVNNVRVSVYAMDGKKIHESTFDVTHYKNPAEFDLSFLAAGTYLIKVNAGEDFKSLRIVKL